MDYQKAWQFLDDLQFFKIKLGLDSMQSFLANLDNPQNKLKFIHIAGTNGKGSTAAALFSILCEAGYKVGFYSSPHLSSVRERFRIDNRFISEEQFTHNAEKIIRILSERQITYFEFTTTLALLWFVEECVDIAIMEVGMGGRLDATNVIQPCVSIITNVSMDHEAYLGDTIAAVAAEKAGIIKTGVPVVSGVSLDESREIIQKKAQREKAPLYFLGKDFTVQKNGQTAWDYSGIGQVVKYEKLVCGLTGFHQMENSSLSLAAIELLQADGFEVSETHIRKGLEETRWPGRLEYFFVDRKKTSSEAPPIWESNDGGLGKVRYLLDGAHNPAGVLTLKNSLLETFSYKSLIGVWASMADKDICKTFLPIAPLFDRIVLTRLENERSAQPIDLKNMLPSELQKRVVCCESVEMALAEAENMASADDLICVAGSLYLVGRARHLLLGECTT